MSLAETIWRPVPRHYCADGFSVSVQASGCHHCKPQQDAGPYTHVEVGFPSEKPEPWFVWRGFAVNSKNPLATIYRYVPLNMVQELIQLHGGLVE